MPHRYARRTNSNIFATLAVIRCAENKKPPGTNYAYRDYQASLFGWGPRMAVDGHGHAMTIADYIAIGVLIVLAISAGGMLYLRGKL
jgi:hypothetical protein